MTLRLVGLTVLFVACGSGTTAQPEAPTPEPSNTAPEAPPDDGPCPDPAACVEEGERLRASDAARALELFTAACERAHPRGCEAEAELLTDYRHHGLPQDDARGARAWDRACTLGNAHACYRYGFYLWEGIIGAVVIDGEAVPYRWSDHRPLGIPLIQRGCDGNEARACELLAELRAAGQLP